jgi:hypothetical protein
MECVLGAPLFPAKSPEELVVAIEKLLGPLNERNSANIETSKILGDAVLAEQSSLYAFEKSRFSPQYCSTSETVHTYSPKERTHQHQRMRYNNIAKLLLRRGINVAENIGECS